MYRYTCLNPIAEVGLNQFSKDYCRVEEMKEADAVLVRSANMREMEIPDSLCAIARAGAGVNNIPLELCAEKGIVVFNTPGANANGVKELVFAGMLLAARDIIGGACWTQSQAGNPDVAKLTEKEKKRFAGSELQDKKLGIIGLGAIGVQVANAASHLGMEVYGYDPYISVDAAWNLSRNIKHIKEVDEIYRQCDYITIHVPLMESTKKMINRDAIAKMKKNVVILNFARDLLVDEEAVIEAIDEGRVYRYVSDFPNPVTVGKKGVIVTPHLGASTVESEDNCAVMAVKEIKNFLENGNIRNSVNYPNCDLGICEAAARLAIYHKNIKKMISRFADVLSDTNIKNMSNTSKGDYAYTLFDLDSPVDEDTIGKLKAIEGVIKVRVVK
ncbi:MAG: 3-phosphoglycerate dehydrogenase family protein [Candidatus Choladocola sp.]|nr:3-phosphoglycerate dehydrogenase family protein [Candidatus Choladocola sp.]